MVDSISSSSSSYNVQQSFNQKAPSSEEMFSKLTEELGGDGTTITKDQLDSYIKELESSDSEDKGKLGFLKQLSANFDSISGGDDSITADELDAGMEYLKPPTGGPQGAPSGNMFSDLSSKVGADSNGISKQNLLDYLDELESDDDSDSKEVELVKNLISDFDSVSNEDGYITSDTLDSFMQNMITSKDWQDPSTITSEQLESPIDIRV